MEHVACNLCGAGDALPYCRVGEFQIVRCKGCGLFYTNPRRPAAEIAQIYSEGYFVSQNPDVLGYDDYSNHARGLKEVFSEHLGTIEKFAQPPGFLLDIGCAFGYFLEVAASRGWKAEGIEVSAYASKVAREKAGARVYMGTVTDAGLPASSYDVATMWDMLEHSFDPAAELKETNRILKPHGYLFMTLPDAGSLIARIMGQHWFGFKKAAEHNYYFSKTTLARMLAKTGFKLVAVRRGVWPCSMWFLTSKLTPYSATLSRYSQSIVRWLGLENTVVKFRFIDMFVVARKEDVQPVSRTEFGSD